MCTRGNRIQLTNLSAGFFRKKVSRFVGAKKCPFPSNFFQAGRSRKNPKSNKGERNRRQFNFCFHENFYLQANGDKICSDGGRRSGRRCAVVYLSLVRLLYG